MGAVITETLLALAGHESSLFDQFKADDIDFVTPAESALLDSLARLARLHRALRSHTDRVKHSKLGSIARAVALRIETAHLSRFQRALIDFETSILSHDPNVVSAYDHVPLASVVSRFAVWTRSLEWLWEVMVFICPPAQGSTEPLVASHSGPDIINFLRNAMRTGFSDIEKIAKDLSAAAEKVWLRQLASLLISVDLQRTDDEEFFIARGLNRGASHEDFQLRFTFLPVFLTEQTARSILFIARLSTQLYQPSGINYPQEYGRVEQRLRHVQRLTSLALPMTSTAFSAVVSQMRSDLISELAANQLPTQNMITVLEELRRFFLVGFGDFTEALIRNADAHLHSRHAWAHSSDHLTKRDLAGLMIKENEIVEVLNKTFSSLVPIQSNSVDTENALDWARENLLLGLSNELSGNVASDKDNRVPSHTASNALASSQFNQFLFSTPTKLSVKLSSPLDIFLSPTDLSVYSSIHSCLLSIRRAHMHISDLWRQPSLRRRNPLPTLAARNGRYSRSRRLQQDEQKNKKRDEWLRSIWPVMRTVLYVLSELGEYFTGEVISKSWRSFMSWASGKRPSYGPPAGTEDDLESDAVSRQTTYLNLSPSLTTKAHSGTQADPSSLDPELLALGHRQFLEALAVALMLPQKAVTTALSLLLQRCDEVLGYIHRLQTVWYRQELQDEGVEENFGSVHHDSEAEDIQAKVLGTTKRVEEAMQKLILSLRDLDMARNNEKLNLHEGETRTGFEPWTEHRVDRLLFRLEQRVLT